MAALFRLKKAFRDVSLEVLDAKGIDQMRRLSAANNLWCCLLSHLILASAPIKIS